MIIIKCTNCKKEKSEEEFSTYNGKRNKQCKKCREYYNNRWALNPNAYTDKRKEYYRNTKEKHQARNFKNTILTKYNLSVDEYNRMLIVQNNKCAICSKEFVLDGSKSNLNKLPCIDHCHQTNKVRGLLCRKCNISLYYIESLLFEKAKEYLRVHGSIR